MIKKIVYWLLGISAVVFVVDWGVLGIKIWDHQYDHVQVYAYIGLAALIVMIGCLLYARAANR